MEIFTVNQEGRRGEDLARIRRKEKGSRASRCFHFGSAEQTEIGKVYLAAAAAGSSVSVSA